MNNNIYTRLREHLFFHRREVEIELFEALWEDLRDFFSARRLQHSNVADRGAGAQLMIDRFVSIIFHRNEEGALKLPSFPEAMLLADAFKLCSYDERSLKNLADREENIAIIPDGQDHRTPEILPKKKSVKA